MQTIQSRKVEKKQKQTNTYNKCDNLKIQNTKLMQTHAKTYKKHKNMEKQKIRTHNNI